MGLVYRLLVKIYSASDARGIPETGSVPVTLFIAIPGSRAQARVMVVIVPRVSMMSRA